MEKIVLKNTNKTIFKEIDIEELSLWLKLEEISTSEFLKEQERKILRKIINRIEQEVSPEIIGMENIDIKELSYYVYKEYES